MFEKVKNKIQNSGIIRKANYGKIWQEKFGDKQIQWYEGMHKSCLKMHDNFKEFIHENSPSTILEVGCGAGYYPINLKELFVGKEYVGIDISETAVKLCNSIYNIDNLDFAIGDSENIPFANEKFDVVINVESSHCYGSMQSFLGETFRILKPGGVFLFCDLRETSALEELFDQFNNSGLRIIQHQDITKNIIEALTKMSTERKNAIQRSVPGFFRKAFESYAGVKGSKIYDSFKNGTLSYVSACLEKPM